MKQTSLTDAQIDARATAYAHANRVSYSEALKHALEFAETQADTATNAPQKAMPLTDAQVDAQARIYAAKHGVDYVTALRIVVQGDAASQATRGDQQANSSTDMDRLIDAAATAHARATGASYAEALGHVTFNGTARFSEGSTAIMDTTDAVQALQSQPIEIFRAGQHVDSSGSLHNFSVDDVKAMAIVYSPARHESPLVLGHPEIDHPAYGWVKSLTATEDGRLMMQAGNVDPEFAADVKAGRYKKRSASFYPPLTPGNPVPGQWYLRHVGWLGAGAPSVKGLADVNFGTRTDSSSVRFDLA